MLSGVSSVASRARSARTITVSGLISAKPPRTRTRVPWFWRSVTTMKPVLRPVMTGAWPGRTVISPSVPGSMTASTSPEKSTRSGATSSKWKVATLSLRNQDWAAASAAPSEPARRTVPYAASTRSLQQSGSVACATGVAGRGSRRFRGQALRLLDRLLDGADHVEGRLREMVVFAVDEALEAFDGVLEGDELARRAGEHLGDEEGL